MTILGEHQEKLLVDMVKLIQLYRDGKVAYSRLVDSLQGALDMADLRSKEFTDKWYSYFIQLETLNALSGDDTKPEKVKPVLDEMERYILSML